ncbi:hypothetical protein TIFTF001_041326 [Ficus carica]|uniref:AAA+ ATPase domain-containing protein n=1 Tax=Ficus carica TaxID=3494 RepID=A0AA87Z4K0_FICCA|nr:hypothetical protein TIFTF001_041326 [Ficus carica]
MERIASALAGSSDQLDEKMVTLKRKLQVLESKQDDVKEELKRVEYSFSTKKPRKEVQHWLAEVERLNTAVQQKEKEVHERRSWWGNKILRGELHRSVDKLTTEVEELAEQSKFPRGLTLESHEGKRVPFPTSSLIGETFQKNKSEILDCLMGDKDSVIGIYGMGGVGKTTLLTHIHNELLKRRIEVSWVNVSQNFSIQKLQHDIAKAIDLDISKEDDERKRAAQLAWAFQRQKNFILILDDVWENISLEKVGICVGENGRKLILTTRSLEVCRMIYCEKKIKVQPLSNVEAWALFVKTLGNQTLLSGQNEGIAKSLVEECDGLPLGIIVMAGSMKGVEDIREWRHALEEIRDVKHDDMQERVFRVLEYSYLKLNGKVQECFLYCSLYPEDEWIRRDELIEHFIDEKLVDGMKSRKSQFDEGHVIVNKLENICLLEPDGLHEHVKMHDLVRDMALSVTRVGPPRFLVQAGMKLEDIPNEEKWSEDLVRVSLMRNYIKSIPFDSSPPKCPTLLTLLLRDNDFFRVIPRLFFMHMKSLTVLDLSDTSIDSLPSSISNLESLTALLLQDCGQLRFVPSLENLTTLRRLELQRSAIEEVPKGLEKLINLRYLSFEGCLCLLTMPDGILSKLSQIEYFKSSEKVTLRGEEIGSLEKLENFSGRFKDISEFNSCIRLWEEWAPEEYSIHVGNWYDDADETDILSLSRHVILNELATDSEDTLDWPRGTEFLKLHECHGITSLSHNATVKKEIDLWKCQVSSCDSMRHVICSREILQPEGLPMLTDFVERERSPSSSAASSMLPINTFFLLKELEIKGCHGLKRLFTPTLLSNLQSLESCEVGECSQLVEIIGETSDEDENRESTTAVMTMPPGLQFLELIDLPELKSFCNSSIKVSDSLKDVVIRGCPRLMRITLLWEEPHPDPSLQSIYVEKDWWDTVEWKHPKTKEVLQPYVWFIPA